MEFVVILRCCFSNFFSHYQLEEQDSEGQCNSECKTIERACQEVCVYFKFKLHLLSAFVCHQWISYSRLVLKLAYVRVLNKGTSFTQYLFLNQMLVCWCCCTVHHLKCSSCTGLYLSCFLNIHISRWYPVNLYVEMFVITKLVMWNLQVIGYSDTDVAEYLYNSKPDIDSLRNYLCKDLTKACSTKPPPVPKVTIVWNWCFY